MIKSILGSHILGHYCSRHSERPTLAFPFLNGDYICATDAYTAIRVREDCVDFKFPPMEKPIQNFHGFYELTQGKEREVPVLQWKMLLEDMKTEDEWEDGAECENCDGEGTILCDECGHLNDCRKCDGTGKKTLDKKTGRKTYKRYEYLVINDTVALDPRYLERAMSTFFELNNTGVKHDLYRLFVKYQDEKAPIQFIIRNFADNGLVCEILIMPVTKPISEIEKKIYTLPY